MAKKPDKNKATGTIALNKRAHGRIGSQFEHRKTTKAYIARVAGIIDQPWTQKSWDSAEAKAGFFHGKQLVWQCLAAFGIDDLSGDV